MQDEEYAWFRRLMYEIFKLNPKERMVAKEVVRYLPPSWKVGTPQAWGLSYLGRRAIWVAVDGGCAVGCAARGFSRTRFTGAHSMPIPPAIIPVTGWPKVQSIPLCKSLHGKQNNNTLNKISARTEVRLPRSPMTRA